MLSQAAVQQQPARRAAAGVSTSVMRVAADSQELILKSIWEKNNTEAAWSVGCMALFRHTKWRELESKQARDVNVMMRKFLDVLQDTWLMERLLFTEEGPAALVSLAVEKVVICDTWKAEQSFCVGSHWAKVTLELREIHARETEWDESQWGESGSDHR